MTEWTSFYKKFSPQEAKYKINLQYKNHLVQILHIRAGSFRYFSFSLFYFLFFSPASMRVISYMLIQSFLSISFAIAAIYLSWMLLACERGTRTSEDV